MKVSSKVFFLILGVFFLSSMAVFAKGQTETSATGPKLVYFIFTGYTYPYFAPMADGVKQANAHYPDLNIKIVDANNSASQQITDINEAIAAGAKGIILNPIQESVTSAAKKAVQQGIPIVAIDRDLSDPSARLAFIGDDDVTLGKEATQYAVDMANQHNVPTPWNVVVLQGTLGASTATDRVTGAMQVLQPLVNSGKVKIILNQSANFATDTAQTMISTLLAKTTDIQLIDAGNDAMALGAITALQNAGITPGQQTFVVGADAQPESLDAVKAGTQLATVTHSPFLEAVWAVEAMDNYLTTGTKPPAADYPNGNVTVPMTVVNASNVANISAWGTPTTIPPLPYGTASAMTVMKSGS